MTEHDQDDENYWDRELSRGGNGNGSPSDSEATTSGTTTTESGAAPGGPGAAPAPARAAATQRSLTHFFGASVTTRSRTRGDPVPESSTASSSSRRRPREQTPASRATTSTSTTPNSNSDSDPEVAGLTQDEKDKVYSTTSLLWHYFTKTNKDHAKCNLCAVTGISTPTGATTLLQRHLKVHLQQYSEYNKLQNTKKKMALKKANERSRDVPDKRVIQFPLDTNGKKAKQITNAIALFMAKGLKPYSVVEELGFQHLIYILEPRYLIPSRTQFSRYVIPNLYISEKKKLQIRLQELSDSNNLESISLTIDAWTSRKMDSFLAFTLQFINPVWKMERHTLDLDPFPGAHTADLICERMEEKISEYNLNDENIAKYVTSDNGSNMLAALEQPSEERMLDAQMAQILREKKAWEHLKCFDHTAQLAITDTKKDMNVNNVIDKLSKLVRRYSKSRIALESFEKFQGELNLPKHDLLQRVKTRWNSDFIMMARAVEQKQAIVAECTAAGEDHLTTQEWKLAEGFVEVLRPLAEHTDEMGSEKKPTASMILPTIFEITSDLKEFIRSAPRGTGIQFTRQVLSNLNTRYDYYAQNPTLKIATLVDPRYKNILEDESWLPTADKILEEKAEEKYRSRIRRGLEQPSEPTVNLTPPSGVGTPSSSTSDSPATKKSRWRHLQMKSAGRSSSNVTEDEQLKKIKDEVQSYLLLPNIEVDADPLEWWKANQSAFPNLSLVAKHYLGIAGTEAASERVASTGSMIATPKRTNILSEHLKELAFLHDNLKVPEMK